MAEYLGCLIVEFTFFWLRLLNPPAKPCCSTPDIR